ncbi:hypothetical protein MAR_026523 [Mya arenaria]|uniref:Uncharacterized protein n=1 Tax=Mya arenaria TaxID=6604 RepID=A0ABY7EQY4_MYAAR|nr:hypothetical protein MAR_026523 [Mya arenaria]
MALTSGERSALWRKRQRENETKHEEYKRKERERYKKRKALGQLKPIKDLTEREKRQKRRNWKTHAKNKRDKEKSIKTALASICTPPNSPEGLQPIPQQQQQQQQQQQCNKVRGRRKKNLNRSRAYRAQFRLKIELNKERRLKNKYKTRYYRLIRSQKEDDVEETVKNIMSSQKTMKSTLTLYCLLVNNLRTKYASSNRKIKQILKSLVFRESMLRKYKLKSYTGKATGISMRETRTRESNFRLKQIAIRRTIENDNSRFKAGKKSTRTKRKRKMQVRLLNDTIANLHQKYLFENKSKISYSLFARLKPFWVIQASEKDRQTCLCKVHENPLMKLNKLNFEKAIEHRDLRKLIKDITCNDRQKSCMYRTCDRCKDNKIKTCTDNANINSGKIVTWKVWKSRRIERKDPKNDTGISKTNITVREPETGTISTLVDELQTDIERLARHEFNIAHQYITLKKLKETCKDDELIMHVDFSENYQSKLTEEIQSMHFGGSKRQISIHTGVAYVHNKTISFATISDTLSHAPPAIWAHLQPIILNLKDTYPRLKKLHMISDGPTTQYRCKTIFYLFATKLFDLGFSEGGSWNFMEAGHGKGAPDGVGAALKRNADALVNTHNRDVICAADLVDGLQLQKSTILAVEVKENDVILQEQTIPLAVSPVPQTMKLHQITCKEKGVVSSRVLSCFCSENCSCYDPVTTRFDVNDSVLVVPVSLDESLIDRFCVVDYDGRPYPGKIVDVDDNNIEVSAMHCIGDNRFFWPLTPDVIWYEGVKVVTLLNNEPSLVTTRHRAIDKTVWEAIVKKMEL